MISKASQKNVHISPRKAGLVVDLIRHRTVNSAIAQLENTDKKAATLVLKLLRSCVANATNNHRMNASKLYILSAVANEGPTLKRVLPRAKGSAHTIKKRTTNFEIIVSDDENDLLLQRESYKKNNKYNDLIHGKLNLASQARNTRKSQLIEEANKKSAEKDLNGAPDDSPIYTKEEFDKIKLADISKKKKTSEVKDNTATEVSVKETEAKAKEGDK